MVLPQSFIGEEKERLVLFDWAAETGAEVIALERGLWARGRDVEKVSRIKGIVPEELKCFAMIIIRARTCGQVYDSTRISSVLRRKGRIVDFIFCECVNRRLERQLVLYIVVQIDSVDEPVGRVFALTRSVDAK